MTDILFEQKVGLKFSVCARKVTQVSVSSQISRPKYPPAFLTLICCCTLTRWHTQLEKNILTEKFRAKWNSKFFAIEAYFCTANRTQQICCARLWTVQRADFQNKTVTFLSFCQLPNTFLSFSTQWLLSVLLACVRRDESLHRLLCLVVCGHEWEHVWTKAWFENFCHLFARLHGCWCLPKLIDRDMYVDVEH
jgi:hypothetical protein